MVKFKKRGTDCTRDSCSGWMEELKEAPSISTLHGIEFITNHRGPWIGRVLWFIIVSISWYSASVLMTAQYNAFYNNPISFVVETTYKDWNTDFPSIALCETDNVELLEKVSDLLWTPHHNFDLEEVLKEIAYFKSVAYYTERYCGQNNSLEGCFYYNLTFYANMVRSNCEDLIQNCTWNAFPFHCCEYFRPIQTELGLCYVINSVQGMEEHPLKLTMISNHKTGPGKIYFEVTSHANVYVINEEEVPTTTTQQSEILSIMPQFSYNREIVIRSIENDATAKYISPERRKCRYKYENNLQVYRYYSYSACTVQCRKDAQLKICGCCNFFMPNTTEEEKCDIHRLTCLDENNGKEKFQVLKASWSNKMGLVCDCLPSCTEAEISIVRDTVVSTEEPYASVEIGLSALPSEKYRRNVVRDTLDLIVSMGGTAGLFMGASLLTLVELLYLFMLRPFCGTVIYRWVEMSDKWHYKYGKRTLEKSKFSKTSQKENMT